MAQFQLVYAFLVCLIIHLESNTIVVMTNKQTRNKPPTRQPIVILFVIIAYSLLIDIKYALTLNEAELDNSTQLETANGSSFSPNNDAIQPSVNLNQSQDAVSFPSNLYRGLLGQLGYDFSSQSKQNFSYNSPSSSKYQNFKSTSLEQLHCKPRVKLDEQTGILTDGLGLYPTNLQCSWLIDSGKSNATIHLRVHQFNTECNYDYLYIFDGDSIYSPLIAALSGDIDDFSTDFQDKLLADNVLSHQHYPIPKDYNSTDGSLAFFNKPFEILTRSGKAFIYFHSDTAQSMQGFYINYRINSCSLDCSGNGLCDTISLKCNCNSGFHGDGCQYKDCPNNCTSPTNGICDKKNSICVCFDDYSGPDCSRTLNQRGWTAVQNSVLEEKLEPRAFHQAIVKNDTMWIFGGKTESLSNPNDGIFMEKRSVIVVRYDFINQIWMDDKIYGVTNIDHLAELSSHTAVEFEDKVYIFGGLAYNNSIMNTLTIFDLNTMTILTKFPKKVASYDEEYIAPISVVGHSANMIDGFMYIFMGYNPLYGYLNIIQKYSPIEDKWSIINPRGAFVKGLIGHTTSYHRDSDAVFLFGGHNEEHSSNLYSFDMNKKVWSMLHPAPSSRHFHCSVILGKSLVVIGGNGYNISSHGDKCFRKVNYAFDLSCYLSQKRNPDGSYCRRECWHAIEPYDQGVTKRQGHSIVSYNSSLIMFGGFNGMLLNQLHRFDVVLCSKFKNEDSCSQHKIGNKCLWDNEAQVCLDIENVSKNSSLVQQSESKCTKGDHGALQQICESRQSCHDCMNTSLGCVWCDLVGRCKFGRCKPSTRLKYTSQNSCIKDYLEATSDPLTQLVPRDSTDLVASNEIECRHLNSCFQCYTRSDCSWHGSDQGGCDYNTSYNLQSNTSANPIEGNSKDSQDVNAKNKSSKISGLADQTNEKNAITSFNRSTSSNLWGMPMASLLHESCDTPCFKRKSCLECTTTKCIWCSTSQECIDSSAYFAYHNIGQCMHYVAHNLKCDAASCSDIESCDECLANPKCGWMNDRSDTGKGKCMDGDSSGPTKLATYNHDKEILKPTNWYYSSCPPCQCNGHSICNSNSSTCHQPCFDFTEGPNCDKCISGYYGDPSNGGLCKPCRCNGHAQTCNSENGKCHCSTKGIIGHTCNRCDDLNHYVGEIGTNWGTCSYNLTTDYQYTFNLSKPEDYYYSEINFINLPTKRDVDVDFMIVCSKHAMVNITSGFSYTNSKYELILSCSINQFFFI